MTDKEILFKAKRLDNDRWIVGYYVYHINRTICVCGDSVKPEDEEHLIVFDDFSDWNMPRGLVYVHVDPETLCRRTGKLDAGGKNIFENDVVIIDDGVEDERGIVKWDEDDLAWVVVVGSIVLPLGEYASEEIKVLDNVLSGD